MCVYIQYIYICVCVCGGGGGGADGNVTLACLQNLRALKKWLPPGNLFKLYMHIHVVYVYMYLCVLFITVLFYWSCPNTIWLALENTPLSVLTVSSPHPSVSTSLKRLICEPPPIPPLPPSRGPKRPPEAPRGLRAALLARPPTVCAPTYKTAARARARLSARLRGSFGLIESITF